MFKKKSESKEMNFVSEHAVSALRHFQNEVLLNRITKLEGVKRILNVGTIPEDSDKEGRLYSNYFPEKKYFTLDKNRSSNKDNHFKQDLHNIKIKEEKFDLVICMNTLEHVINPFEVAKELQEIVAENGYLFVSTPLFYPIHKDIYGRYSDYWRFSDDGIRELFKDMKEIWIDLAPSVIRSVDDRNLYWDKPNNTASGICALFQKNSLIELDPSNYFLPKGYKSNDVNLTVTENRKEPYWLDWRINMNRYFQYDVYEYAAELVKTFNLDSVLDLGCGPAVKLVELIYPVTRNITGIDQQEAIDYCIKHYKDKGTFVADDLENPKIIKNRKYDLIICADVIEHLVNPDKLMHTIKSLLSEKGIAVISTPERDLHRGKGINRSNKPEHVREWNRVEFGRYVENKGFIILEHNIVPFIKIDLHNELVMNTVRSVLERVGTINTSQMVICRKN